MLLLAKGEGEPGQRVTFACRILISAIAQFRPLNVQMPIYESHVTQDECAVSSYYCYKHMQTQRSTLPSGKQRSALRTVKQVGQATVYSCIRSGLKAKKIE